MQEGVILKYVDYKENDRIITIFTKEGKISVIAKGLKNNKRFNSLDIGNWINFQSIKTKGIPIITTTKLIDSFAKTKEKYSLYVFFLLEIIQKIQREGEDEDLLYKLLIYSLKNLEKNPKIYSSLFLVKILIYEGVFIDLNNCNICKKKLSESNRFIISSEGISHEECNMGNLYISLFSLKLLKYFSLFDIEINSINFEIEDEIKKETLFYMISFMENFLGKEINSKKYII